MREVKQILLKLQSLDQEIDELEAERDSIPDKKIELENALKQETEKVEALKKESLDLAKKRKEMEIELESLDEKKVRFQMQLLSVKTNREYEALQHEIADLDKQRSALEDRIIESLERGEKVAEEIRTSEEQLKSQSQRIRNEQLALDQRLKQVEDEIAIKKDERLRLTKNLDATLLKRYERIRSAKGGVAVTTVVGGACGGCFRSIPPHEMQNLKRDDRLIACEGCGRILIWKPE